jgi:membrane-associated phospholipid phosphatase
MPIETSSAGQVAPHSDRDGRSVSKHRPATSARLPASRIVLLAIGFGALSACLAVFGIIAEDVHRQEVIALDDVVTPFLHGYASPTLDSVMWAITTLGSTLFVTPVFLGTEALLLMARRRREALFLAIAILGSVIMNGLLKLIFQRPRPQLPWAQTPLDFSFPSGHTMNSLVFYLALALIAWVIWGPRVGIPAAIAAVGLAVLIGVSRIYLGAHYFSDVAAGFLAGLAWLLIVSAGFDAGSWLERWRSERPQAKPSGVPPL